MSCVFTQNSHIRHCIKIKIERRKVLGVIFIAYVKVKIALGDIKQERKFLFKVIAIGEKSQNWIQTQIHWNIKQSDFKSWSEKIIGNLCLLVGFSQRKSKLSHAFMTGVVLWLRARYPPCPLSTPHPNSQEVRLLSLHRNWEIEALSSLLMPFQRYGSQVL